MKNNFNSSFPTFPMFYFRSSKMELLFKTMAGLLLLVQAFQSVALQHSTETPRRTIDKAWLRDLVRNRTGGVIPAERSEPDQGSDPTLDPIPDYSGGITSGSMAILNEEEESNNADEEPYDLNVVTAPEFPVDLNVTTKEPFLDVNSSTTPLDSTNVTDVERELNHSSAIPPSPATLPTVENSTLLSDFNQSNSPTTSAPGGNAMQETPTTPTEVRLTTNAVEPTDTRTTEIGESSTSPAAATSFQPSTSSGTSGSAVPDTPEAANKTGSGAGSGSSSERGRFPFLPVRDI